MWKKFIVIAFLLILTISLMACQDAEKVGMIVGKVVNPVGDPVEGAAITVVDQIATTNARGEFEIFAEIGLREIGIAKGETSVIRVVEVNAGEMVTIEIVLELPIPTAISTVKIEAKSGPVSVPIPEGHVRLHYLRTDGQYEGWGLHLWGSGYVGPEVTWTSPLLLSGVNDYGVYWDIPYNQGLGDLNFIIHRGDIKDPDGDRKYPNPDNNREIFCITGDSTAYLNFDESLTALGKERLDIPAVPEGYVRLHYFRSDGLYDGWGLHLWGSGYAGLEIQWGSPVSISGMDTYGAYWDIPYAGEGDLNFIIHRGNVKDPDGDRIYTDPANNRELWAVSAELDAYTSRLAALKAMGNKIDSAVIVGSKQIEIRLSAPLKDAIRVLDGKKPVPLSKLDSSREPIYLVEVREELDFDKSYRIEIGKLTSMTVLSAAAIDDRFAYDGELGNFYSPHNTIFKVWAPVASAVQLYLFADGQAVEPNQIIDLTKKEQGIWSVTVEGDLAGKFYQYAVTNAGEIRIGLDPYAKSMAAFDINGNDPIGKGAVVDLERTDPTGWENDTYVSIEDLEDVVLYEMSVRDFTIAENSGVALERRGTYLGFIEKIPHLLEMGITHVQLQPIQNFYYGNEFDRSFENIGSQGEANYNWGYDPHNYNTPEGWYSLNPADPHLRIKEVKELVKALHDVGIGVVLDVVYNHTAKTEPLENLVPNYYYRRNTDGSFTSGSGCGNDTASERKMWRKFMVESTKYWVEEYHIDGFRFDLMGLHDEATIQEIAATLRKINPDIELHGEAWNMGTLPETDRYIKNVGNNWSLLEMEHAVAAFNDTIRDALIQEYYASPLPEGGFIQAANPGKEELIRAGIIAGMIDYTTDLPIEKGAYHRFADDPEEVITYVNCHDGYTIWDKIVGSTPNGIAREQIKTNKLAAAIIFTSQGKAFMHGGEEMLRTKPDPDNIESGIDHNSYDSGDLTNQIDWSRKDKYAEVVEYYKGLIELRKSHEAFRMETMEEIKKGLTFINENEDYLIAFRLMEQDGTDEWQKIVVIYNANRTARTITVDGVDSGWKVVVDGERAGIIPLMDTEVILGNGTVTVPAVSAVVIYR